MQGLSNREPTSFVEQRDGQVWANRIFRARRTLFGAVYDLYGHDRLCSSILHIFANIVAVQPCYVFATMYYHEAPFCWHLCLSYGINRL